MDKIIVLYHADCADGFAAAYAAWKHLGSVDVGYTPVCYGDPPPDVSGKQVYILDFSYPPEILFDMADKALNVVILDHHKTAEDQWWDYLKTIHHSGERYYHGANVGVFIDKLRSGAQMAWDWFCVAGEARPTLIDHVGDRDLWKFDFHHTKAYCAGLSTLPKDFATWDRVAYAGSEGYGSTVRDGVPILRAQAATVERTVDRMLRLVMLQHMYDDGTVTMVSGYAANVCENISETGDAIAKKHNTFSLTFFVVGNDAVCSLRSIGALDVTRIARCYGGGGHTHAAGFKMKAVRFFEEIWA